MSRTRSTVSVFKQLVDYIAVRVADELAARARHPQKKYGRPHQLRPGDYAAVIDDVVKRNKDRLEFSLHRTKDRCSARGCHNPARAKGLCTRHYQKARYDALKAGAKK
jgi:hypothetical protein